MSFQDAYNMPVPYRNYFVNLHVKKLEEMKKSVDKEKNNIDIDNPKSFNVPDFVLKNKNIYNKMKESNNERNIRRNT
ncbi:MAG: hypothetical protein IRZ03_15745 [Acidobacterium ailaaui]|nr:hypothetical protein [Pseudacidobacterium ailaaui]